MSDVNGKVVWYEIVTPDREATTRFYSEVIGWKVSEMEGPGGEPYAMLGAPGEAMPQCGVDTWQKDASAHWVGYFEAGEIEAAMKRVRDNGGEIIGEVQTMPGTGKMVKFADPAGATAFLFEGEQKDSSGYDSKPGKFHWYELMVPDAEKVLPFYRAVFGYDIQAMDMGPGGTYHVFESGGESRAGTMTIPPGMEMPTAWTPYVHVADLDAALKRVEQQGGTATPAMDVPDVGRMAHIVDPTGAVLGLITPPAM